MKKEEKTKNVGEEELEEQEETEAKEEQEINQYEERGREFVLVSDGKFIVQYSSEPVCKVSGKPSIISLPSTIAHTGLNQTNSPGTCAGWLLDWKILSHTKKFAG